MALPKSRIAVIHVAKAKLGLADDSYRDILRNVAGVDSSRELDAAGFDALMLHFERLGFKSDLAQRNIGNRFGMASPGQVARLRRLWSNFTAGKGDDVTLGKWLHHQCQVSAVRFLTTDQAHSAIGALSRMIAKRKGGSDGQATDRSAG